MEPYYLSFLSLKSRLDTIKIEIKYDSFPADDDNPDNIEVNSMIELEPGSILTTTRYDIIINGWYHGTFLSLLENAFNEFNREIKKNLRATPIKESIPTYLQKLTEQLMVWYNDITEHNLELDSETKWYYLPKSTNKGFLEAEGFHCSMLDNISSLFVFIKDTCLEILESIKKFEDPNYGTKGADETEELFSDIHSQTRINGPLDIYQTALLFFYLKKHQGINSENYNSIAKNVSALTGYSEQNIRTTKGFGVMGDILSDRAKNQHHKDEPNYNLITVKEFTQNIIDDIDKQIVKNNS